MKRIGHLYTLDLDSVNNVISDINIALESMEQGNSVVSSPGMEVVWDEKVGVGTTEITKSDLDIVDGIYGFHFEAFAGTDTDYYLYFNRDKTGANYRTVYLYSVNGAAAQGNAQNFPFIGDNEASGRLICNGNIYVDKQQNLASVLFSWFREPTHNYVTGAFHWEKFSDYDKINHLTLTASVGGQLGKDSHIFIWKAVDK